MIRVVHPRSRFNGKKGLYNTVPSNKAQILFHIWIYEVLLQKYSSSNFFDSVMFGSRVGHGLGRELSKILIWISLQISVAEPEPK
jgi:hypothetical protein